MPNGIETSEIFSTGWKNFSLEAAGKIIGTVFLVHSMYFLFSQ